MKKMRGLFAVVTGMVMMFATVMAKPVSSCHAASAGVRYRSHCQNYGTMNYVEDGAVSGTTGQSLRLEGFWAYLYGVSGSIVYRTHCQNYGWLPFVSDNTFSGTSGQGLRAEAVEIYLTGKAAELYDVEYRCHIEGIGDSQWVKNGATCGTIGQSRRIEAIQIRLVPKKGASSGNSGVTASYQSKVNAFLNDERFRNGAIYNASKKPYLSSYSAKGCCAYAVDFCYFVFGKNYSSGKAFYRPSEIKAGDIIKVTNSQHWIVVLERNGNVLKTAEGNWTNGRVCVSSSAYTVSGNTLCRNGKPFRTFAVGYHMQ